MSTYGTDFTRGPAPWNLQPMVHVKVLSLRTTTCAACQTAPASSADASFTSGLQGRRSPESPEVFLWTRDR